MPRTPAVLALLSLAACSGEDATDRTLVEFINATPRFSTLADAIALAELADALDGVTLFAPNDDAFDDLFTAWGIEAVDDLTPEQWSAILTYHVVDGSVDADAAIALAEGAGFADAFGGTLSFALDGGNLEIDGLRLLTLDVEAQNGMLHEVDGVLVPSLVDVITSDPDLDHLESAIDAVDASSEDPDLFGTLSGVGPFTVFAPTNNAFDALYAANGVTGLDALVNAVGVPAVIDVLTYHVAIGQWYADDVSATTTATTLGGTVSVDVAGGTLELNVGVAGLPGSNDAVVVTTDLLTSNGVLHKIDRVITPGT